MIQAVHYAVCLGSNDQDNIWSQKLMSRNLSALSLPWVLNMNFISYISIVEAQLQGHDIAVSVSHGILKTANKVDTFKGSSR